jgi:tRNA threonylcarbamoyl adenosine modification protein (Sua5/YciO/YrdC/YwlC family)
MLVMDYLNDPHEALQRALETVENGGILVYPTDTVYGMGCDLQNKDALDRLYRLKKIPKRKPLSFICSDLKMVSSYGKLSNSAHGMMRKLLPGPFTFILQASREVPKLMISKQRTVGIRVPEQEFVLELVKRLGRPLVNTSASDTLEEVVSDPDQIEEMYPRADLMISLGQQRSEASTILDFTGDMPEVVRQGAGDLSAYLRR